MNRFLILMVMISSVLCAKGTVYENVSVEDGDVAIIIEENAPQYPEYKNMPRFAIVGKDKQFYLNIGATLKTTASFDWGNPYDNPSLFIPGDFSKASEGSGGLLQMTAKRSLVHFNFLALPNSSNRLGVYIAINFTGDGNNYGVQLYNAYIKYRGFTIGYNNTLYGDAAALPYTIDSQGPNSISGSWNTVLDYEYNFTSMVKGGIGLELPMTSITSTSNTIIKELVVSSAEEVTQRIPDIPAYIQVANSDWGHLRFSAIMRNMEYRDEVSEKNHNSVGWGVKISGSGKMGNLQLFGMAQYGEGIASYLQDNIGLGLDMVPNGVVAGEMKNTRSWGGFLAAQYNFTPKFFTTIGYSHLRNYMDEYSGGDVEYADQYSWGQYAVANMIYSIRPNIKFGMEYLYGRRVNFSDEQIGNNRISAMFLVAF
ncbi:MAG: porin [Bacteroidales bacterium]